MPRLIEGVTRMACGSHEAQQIWKTWPSFLASKKGRVSCLPKQPFGC